PPRGNGLRGRYAAGDDWRLPGMAGGRADVLPRPVLRAGSRRLDDGDVLEKTTPGRAIIQCRSRNPFWTLPQHGGRQLALALAVAVAEVGSGALWHALCDILVDARNPGGSP